MNHFNRGDLLFAAVCGTITLAACLTVGMMDKADAEYIPPAPPAVSVTATPVLHVYPGDEKILAALARMNGEDQAGEDPEENAKIEAALLQTGYLREDVPLSPELQAVLRAECDRTGIPCSLALGLIECESSFRTDAANGCSYGLMQLNRRYFPDNLTPAENIIAGMGYLAECMERYGGDLGAALTAYNAGSDTGNREYARRVLAAAERRETGEQLP